MKRVTRFRLCVLYVMIVIVSSMPSGCAPTLTPEEPRPEDIGITSFFFSVNPTTVLQGQCAVVHWAVEPEGDWPVVFNNEEVRHIDQRDVCPDSSQEYELYADPPGPDIHEEIIRLEVVQLGSGDVDYDGAGEILAFQADPERIQLGECTELIWEALAPPDLHFILNGEPVPVSGARRMCPAADTVYELLLFEPDEAVYAHVSVYVDQGSGQLPGSTQSGGPPAETETATPEQQAQVEATASATPTPWIQEMMTPQCSGPSCDQLLWPPTSTLAPTSTATPEPTVPMVVGTLIWPTVTQTPEYIANPEIYLRIVDIFLDNYPIGEVFVRIKNTAPVRVQTGYPYENVYIACKTTIYSPDHAPVAYSGFLNASIRLDPGEVGIYKGFYQVGVMDQRLDFTNGWGDVSCHLTFHYSDYAHYTERLP